MTCLSFRQFVLAAVLLPCAGSSVFAAQQTDPSPGYDLKDKNFYALRLFETDRDLHQVLSRDKLIKTVQTERANNLQIALSTCKGDAACELRPLLWSYEQIEKISSALKKDYEISPAVRKAADSLRRSLAYQGFAKQDGSTLLVSAWTLCAHGLNKVINVYGLGTKPLYPQIDSISFDVSTGTYQEVIHTALRKGLDSTGDSLPMFFSGSLNIAIRLLMLNHRDEAVRFEPLAETVNRSAIQSLKLVDWKSYMYSVILVPGEGPEDTATALSNLGRTRVALAAEAFRQGKAPFIVVSGGFVRPSQTRFAEASEMKFALIRDFGVPETAVLVEPFARHTTTNLRNAVRELYWYRVPFAKPLLVVSDPAQIQYIASPQMATRCEEELGYLPFNRPQRISGTQLSVMPDITSMQQNPLDPLDP